jgi:hypothetical protein
MGPNSSPYLNLAQRDLINKVPIYYFFGGDFPVQIGPWGSFTGTNQREIKECANSRYQQRSSQTTNYHGDFTLPAGAKIVNHCYPLLPIIFILT